MNPASSGTPSWFLRFIIAFTCLQLLIGLPGIVRALTDWSGDGIIGGTGLKLVVMGIVIPIALSTIVLTLRRARSNVIGVLLLLWLNLLFQFFGNTSLSDNPFRSLNISWVAIWMLPAYFPDGKPYPVRWGRWIMLSHVAMILTELGWVFTTPFLSGSLDPQTQQATPLEANPMFISSLTSLKGFFDITQAVSLLISIAWVFTLIGRFRAADAHIRQQIKWLMLVFVIIVGLSVVLIPLNVLNDPFRLGWVGVGLYLGYTTFIYIAPYIAVGNAILRHRLYDIDIIIRRTLIYSVLTGILAALYFGAIILTQQVFRAATGQTSDLAIVVSTLLIAALFSPIRRRVQDGIDRRLYRRKYDVEQTLADFQRNLREDVDMETLKANLIGVVSETMQPDKIALWVKDVK
jgi:hypothetical protein